ncbi:Retrotransposon gag protein [Ceratocystis lukuohia]|uniref:Retrotransposon gag protein n=1 Tax=Ceratocystis lukuohia TaxID=2019550 RepID=A0ABR4M8L0_9PEZI
MDNSSQITNATMRPSNPVRLYDHSKPLDYPAFRTILKAQWKYHRSRFPTQEDFIIHCFSHLTGPAAMDIEPWIQDMMADKETADVEAFFTHLDNTFMDPAAAARALEKVTALQAKMSTPAQAHITQHQNAIPDCDPAKESLRDALVTHQETQYTKYAKVVMVVWQRLCEDFPAMAPRHPPPVQHTQVRDHEDVPVEDVRIHSVPVVDTRKHTMQQNTPAAALGCPTYNDNRALKEGGTEAEAWQVLDNRFDDPGHIDAARMNLNALKQKGDAYEAYVQDFSNLLQGARGQEWPEEIKIDAFRKGLDRKVTYYTLATAPGKTLEEEIKIYRQVYTNIQRNKNLDKFSTYISSPNRHDEAPREYGDPMDIESNYTQSYSTTRPKTTQNSSPGLPDDYKYVGAKAEGECV